MSLQEDLRATWDKRYKQAHYTYRDFAAVTTLVLPQLTALGMGLLQNPLVYYLFGANARLVTNLATMQPYGTVNYPTNCYARDILFLCTQNAWVRLLSVNPEYAKQVIAQQLTKTVPSASPVIVEAEEYVPMGGFMRFHPTMALAMIYRADTVAGALNVWIESNSEGSE